MFKEGEPLMGWLVEENIRKQYVVQYFCFMQSWLKRNFGLMFTKLQKARAQRRNANPCLTRS